MASLGTATIEGTTGDNFQYQNTTYVFGSFGEPEFSTGSIGVAAKLMFPLGESFRFYGKAGAQAWAVTNIRLESMTRPVAGLTWAAA